MQLIDVVPILKAPMLHTWKKRDLLNALKDAPVVDPVHAAGACYCHECDYWNDWDKVETESQGIKCSCAYWSVDGNQVVYTQPDDFCSNGDPHDSV